MTFSGEMKGVAFEAEDLPAALEALMGVVVLGDG